MPTTPHDALFKSTFSQVEHAAGELNHILPPALAALIDFSTLTLCPGSFVEESLAQHHSDLLFSARLAGRDARLYLLFEHQSRVHRLMPFRLLVYEVRVWEAYLREHPDAKRLPVIVPVVLHHSVKGWTAAVSFEALLDADAEALSALGEHVVRFRFVLDDISRENDVALRSRKMSPLGRLVLWCLKMARTPEKLRRGLRGWRNLLREVRSTPNGLAALKIVWHYILQTSETSKVEVVLPQLLAAAGEEAKEEIVTVEDYLIEKGMKKGLEKGRRETLLKLLALRFGALPEATVTRVNAADRGQLDTWLERVITAPTLEAVLDSANASPAPAQ